MNFGIQYPLAAQKYTKPSMSMTGADSNPAAVHLQKQLQELFHMGGFVLRKWNSNEPEVLNHLPAELKESQSTQIITEDDQYTKTLGMEWNSVTNNFRITVKELDNCNTITKRMLISDVSKTFDILSWFSLTIIKVKILLQRLWELKINWNNPVSIEI